MVPLMLPDQIPAIIYLFYLTESSSVIAFSGWLASNCQRFLDPLLSQEEQQANIQTPKYILNLNLMFGKVDL